MARRSSEPASRALAFSDEIKLHEESNMRFHLHVLAAIGLLASAACHNNDQGGNGPGNADGVGGRTDPPAQQPPPEQSNATTAPDSTSDTSGNPPGGTERKPDSPTQ